MTSWILAEKENCHQLRQQFLFGWYAIRNTQYRSIQSHLHRLGYYSLIRPISSYPPLSVVPSHPVFLPFPLSDAPPYYTPKYQFQQGVHITFRLSAECNIKLAYVLSNSVSLTARILKGENFPLLLGRDNSNLRWVRIGYLFIRL